ncbi:MAG: GNAT family N-acetyltransferase [Bacillota bacterium]
MNQTSVNLLQEKDLDQAVEIFLDAFKEEAFTKALLNLSHKKNRDLYFQAIKYKLSFYLEIGHQVYGALENGEITGMFILKNPHARCPFNLQLRRLFPNLPVFARLLPKFLKATHLGTALQPPNNLPKMPYTLEGLAVHPTRQGKGIGRLLLEKAELVCFADNSASGIYLYTGDEKSKNLYRHFNYRILESRPTPTFTAHHMFKDNIHKYSSTRGNTYKK